MIKIFVFLNDLNSLIFLSNKIIQVNHNIKLIGFDNKLSQDSIDICIKSQPDIIICSPCFSDNLSKILDFEYIILECSNLINTEKILNQILRISKTTKYHNKLQVLNFRQKIYYKLQNLNFNVNLVGTTYLIDLIVLMHEKPQYEFNPNYIEIISQKYSTNNNTVIWNVHTCIEDMYNSSTQIFRKSLYGTSTKLNYLNILKTLTSLY